MRLTLERLVVTPFAFVVWVLIAGIGWLVGLVDNRDDHHVDLTLYAAIFVATTHEASPGEPITIRKKVHHEGHSRIAPSRSPRQ